jgi:hypothetical protein
MLSLSYCDVKLGLGSGFGAISCCPCRTAM